MGNEAMVHPRGIVQLGKKPVPGTSCGLHCRFLCRLPAFWERFGRQGVHDIQFPKGRRDADDHQQQAQPWTDPSPDHLATRRRDTCLSTVLRVQKGAFNPRDLVEAAQVAASVIHTQ